MAKTQDSKYKYYKPVPCSNLKTFLSKVDSKINSGWVFRGHRKDCWELRHKFERACTRFNVSNTKRIRIETNVMREFKRRLHNYTANEPLKNATDEWLALMQHHGAPTRLLDFTYSPYVAAFFAFEFAEPDNSVAIWAVDVNWFTERLECIHKDIYEKYDKYRKSREEFGKYFNDIFMGNAPVRFIAAINPFRLNERLTYQRGVFLCPGDVSLSFEENLLVYEKITEAAEHIIKYTISTGLNNENTIVALETLDSMNISRIALSPGLDGFAQSLENRIGSLFSTQYFD